MNNKTARWNFFTNHALVVFYLQAHPNQPLRRVAQAIGITERAVQRMVAELEVAGCLKRQKVGRQNQYLFEGDSALRHPLVAHRTVRDLLAWVEEPARADDSIDETLANWSVGEHGSEVSRQ
jgi:DNA-binding Lrp family transcriptional regulator